MRQQQHVQSWGFAVTGVTIFFLNLATAAAAPPQTSIRLRGCTGFLQLAEAQYKAIDEDAQRLNKLKVERASVPGTPKSDDATAGGSASPASKPEGTSELANLYDKQIGNVETELQSKHKVLTAIGNAYRKCIKMPPKGKG